MVTILPWFGTLSVTSMFTSAPENGKYYFDHANFNHGNKNIPNLFKLLENKGIDGELLQQSKCHYIDSEDSCLLVKLWTSKPRTI